MKKKYFILILLLISVKFWGFVPVAYFFSNVTFHSATGFMWIFIGLLFYKLDFKTLFSNYRYRSFGWLILLSLILSAFSTILFYGQSPMNATLALKEMVFYFTLPLFLLIKPTICDIKKGLYVFAFIYPCAELITTFIPDTLFYTNISLTEAAQNRDYHDYGDFIQVLDGVEFVAFAFFFAMDELRRRFNIKSAVFATFFFFVIFLSQSRSTLFPCSLILLLVVFKMRGKDTKTITIIKVCTLVFMAFVFIITMPMWIKLFDETMSQVGDDDYARNLSYVYFLTEAWPNLWCFIFGNGFLYGKTLSYDIEELGSLGIWSSDVGFVGMWTLTGFIPVIMIIAVCMMSLFGKNKPYYLRFAAFFILATSPTTAWYYNANQIVWLCMFLYIFCMVDYISHKSLNRYWRLVTKRQYLSFNLGK